MTPEQIRKAMHAMYGCDIETFTDNIEDSPLTKLSGAGMIVMSLLSDAQELIEAGQYDYARQTINRAKHLIMHFRLGLKDKP